MSKVYEIEIGGKTRALRYEFADARALARRFKAPLSKLLQEDALGLWNLTSADPEFQVAFVAAGIHRDLRLPVEEVEVKVEGWFTQACAPGGPGIGAWVLGAFKAALYSGVVHGRSVDWDEQFQAQVALREDASGKAQEPAPEAVPS